MLLNSTTMILLYKLENFAFKMLNYELKLLKKMHRRSRLLILVYKNNMQTGFGPGSNF